MPKQTYFNFTLTNEVCIALAWHTMCLGVRPDLEDVDEDEDDDGQEQEGDDHYQCDVAGVQTLLPLLL